MTTNNIIVLCAFIAYMIIMIVIGFVCSKGNKNNEDYFLGGRNLGSECLGGSSVCTGI